MVELLTFFIIIAIGFLSSGIFRKFQLPYVTALIIGGIILGPYFLNIVNVDPTMDFIGSVGVIFLMFIAGSEIKIRSLKDIKKGMLALAFLNGFVPFLVGFLIGHLFGYGFFTSLIIGTVFVSSSVAIVVPALESSGLIKTKLGKTILSATVLEDIGSLLLLAFILQSFKPLTPIPLWLYIPSIALLMVVMKVGVSWAQKAYEAYLKPRITGKKDMFESDLRFVMIVLIATVIIFELIGMHAIVAGFIIGIILADSIKGKVSEKIRVLSYGLFVPVFFIILGIKTDLSAFFTEGSIILTAAIILGLVASKVISGWVGGRLNGFSNRESLLVGVSTMPQLSTTLAAAFAALELGLLDHSIITSLVMLSIVTTLVSPILMSSILGQPLNAGGKRKNRGGRARGRLENF